MESGKKKILIVEDQAHVHRLVASKLEDAGFEVIHHYDGAEALTFLGLHPVDLVVLDLMLPVVGGKEVLARMKASEDLRSIPVLVLTSKSRKTDVDEILALGADDYVIKPFDPADLASRVRNLIHSA